MGDPVKNIREAYTRLEKANIAGIINKSGFYLTEPIGNTNQDDFINSVVYAETTLLPHDLFKALKNIEFLMGRPPGASWKPRIIDIDILFYGDKIINAENLKIPHPEIENRLFVISLLNEIAPDFIHPVIGKSINYIYKNLDQKIKNQKVFIADDED